NLGSGLRAGAAPNRRVNARFLETRTVMILHDDIDDHRHLVWLEPRAAELADSPFEGVRILRHERRDLGSNDLAGDRIRLTAHGDVLNVVKLEQKVLDLGRMHFLATYIDQLRLAAENADVLAVAFDEILRVEP